MQFRQRCPLHTPWTRSPLELSTYHSTLLRWPIRALVPMPKQQEAIHHSVHQAMTVTKALHLTPSQRPLRLCPFQHVRRYRKPSRPFWHIATHKVPANFSPSEKLWILALRNSPRRERMFDTLPSTMLLDATDTGGHGPGRKQPDLIKDTWCGCGGWNHINGRQTSGPPLKLGGNLGLQSIKQGLFLQPPLFQIVNIQILE